MRAGIFRENLERKDILLTFITHNIVLTELTFLTKYRHYSSGLFRENYKKMTLDHRAIENERFLTKQGHESKVY